MELGRIMGLDVGDVRTGVALSDPLQMIASPHSVVQEPTIEGTIAALQRIVEEAAPIRIVAGLPLNQYGQPGPQAEKTLAFLDQLREAVDIEVVTQDERFSTAAAQRTLREAKVRGKKRKKVVDKIAATYILEAYLDRCASQRRRDEEDTEYD